MNKATIYDVAARANVSNATVSRALNNPEKVKPDTRDKILRFIIIALIIIAIGYLYLMMTR